MRRDGFDGASAASLQVIESTCSAAAQEIARLRREIDGGHDEKAEG
jgi:hypothetical protein